MSSPLRARRLLALLTSCALFALPVATASASNSSIISTINADGPVFSADQTAVANAEVTLAQTHDAKPLQRALAKASAECRRFANTLGRQPADTTRFAGARRLIVAGLREIGRADGALSREIKHRSVTQAKINRFNALIKKANAKIRRGERMLPHA